MSAHQIASRLGSTLFALVGVCVFAGLIYSALMLHATACSMHIRALSTYQSRWCNDPKYAAFPGQELCAQRAVWCEQVVRFLDKGRLL